IAACHHTVHELFTEALYTAGMFECRHALAQQIRLTGGEARTSDGHAHRLLLEKRHAQRLAQHALQLWRRIAHLLKTLTTAEIWVDHVALNRTGANDGDLHHQIVEGAGPQTRQHRHL